ncbi:MAG: hypothetical protein IKW27_06395 [Bacteroidales bacterium]|nr:hypothetical protein [Bacteroidales bacterium]
MKRYLLYILTAVLSMMAASCANEEIFAPGEFDDENCYGVYFPAQKGLGDLQIEPDDPTSLQVIVRRTKTRGEIHVPVTIKANYPIFTADEIVFEDGEPASVLTVRFPSAKIATTYECTVSIEGDEFVSKYSSNPSHVSFSVTRVKWNNVVGADGSTTGLWRDAIFDEWFAVSVPNLERSIVLQERDDMPGYYRTFDVYNADYLGTMFQANVSSLCVEQHYTYIDATNPEKVWIPTFKTGVIMHPSYGMMSIASYVAENSDDFDPSIPSVYGTLKDGVITFPYGSIQMKLEMLGWYQANSSGLLRVILPGYRAKDYGVELSAGVSDEAGQLPLSVDMAMDIASVKLAAFEGTLAESVVAEKGQLLADGEDVGSIGEVKVVNKTGSVDFSFENTGVYTVVAAGFDISGNYRACESVSFGYLKAGDDRNQVILTAGLICSDKYAAEGLTSKNSLEIYISGKNIQRLHAGLYEKSKWEENMESLKAAITGSQMNRASLDLVNSTGLFLKQGYLVPGTEYVLVLKAYNGYREEFFVSEAKTGGEWDPRLAEYDLNDVDMNLIPLNKDGYCGEYHYYAMEGNMYSREYLGNVTVSTSFPADYVPSLQGYEFVNIKGLFPMARNFGLEDDSYSFIYYDSLLYNFEQAFESFYSDGALFYPAAYMYAASGSAYGGRMGLMGAFVGDGYLAIIDSGMYASYGEVIDGFAVIAYQDPNQTSYAGLIDMVTGMLLVRPDLDPDPIVSGGQSEAAYSATTTSALMSLDMIIQQGPDNWVETFDGFVMSSFEKARKEVKVKNHLDLEAICK